MATASSTVTGVFPIRRLALFYWLGVTIFLITYGVFAIVLSQTKDWTDTGPLAFAQPSLREPLPGAATLAQALDACFPDRDRSGGNRYKVVGGDLVGRPYYACYQLSADGTLTGARVIEGDDGTLTRDSRIIKQGGAWPQTGEVTSPGGFAIGGAVLIVLFGFSWFCYERLREAIPADTPWSRRPEAMWLAGTLLPVVGWLGVALWPQVPWVRKLRILMLVALGYAGLLIVIFFSYGAIIGDFWGMMLYGSLTAAIAYGVVAGRLLLWPVTTEPAASEREPTDTFDPAEIQVALDRTYLTSQGRLPQDLQATVAQIRTETLELLPHAASFPPSSRELFVLRRIATDYLPTSIETYLALPESYATTVPLQGGKTALQVLKDQLDLLDGKLDEIGEAVRQQDSERLLVHGRFLQDSFGRASEDLRPPPT